MNHDLKEMLLSRNSITSEYIPTIFRPQKNDEAIALEELLKSNTDIQIVDQLLPQLEDLIQTRHPSKKLHKSELDELVQQHLGDSCLEMYGVWVYYSWNRRLVHTLDQSEFVELRTNRNHYKITPAEQSELAKKRVGIVGLSVGQSVAIAMSLERSFNEIRLADFDHLDLSNLNRIRSPLHNLGLNKAIMTAREISEIDPYIKVQCFNEGITDENIENFLLGDGKLDLLIDECDSIDTKIKLRYAAREYGIPVIMGTSDNGLIDIERFDLEPQRQIFHGYVGDLNLDALKDLSNKDKIPFVLKIIGEDTMSTRLKASLIEIETSIKTWPQLGSSVILGGATAADVSRRILLNQLSESGRFFVDLEKLIPNKEAADNLEDPVSSLPELLPPLDQDRMIFLAEKICHQSRSGIASLEKSLIEKLVSCAIKAPSGGNSQPWKWLFNGKSLYLFFDSKRSSGLIDFMELGSMVALGAATENLVLAAHKFGFEISVVPFPLEPGTELAAIFDFYSEANTTTEEHWRDDLFEIIHKRQTNRKLGPRELLNGESITAISEAVQTIQGASLQFLQTDSELDEIGHLIGCADRIRFLHKQLHQELYKEIRLSKEQAEATRDGISLDTLELSPADQAGLRMLGHWPSLQLVKQWGAGRGIEKSSNDAIRSASAVGLITMPKIKSFDYFMGGRAVQRAWLVANSLNVAFYPMTTLPYLFARVYQSKGDGLMEEEIEELHQLRGRYKKLFRVTDDTAEIMLFRLSTASPTENISLRRKLDDGVLFFS